MNWFDLIASSVVLLSLYMIPKNKKAWALYAFGCFLWVVLHWTKGLYFGMVMNTVAVGIGLRNLRRIV